MSNVKNGGVVMSNDLLDLIDAFGLSCRLYGNQAAWESVEGKDLQDAIAALEAAKLEAQPALQCDTPLYCKSVQRCTAMDSKRAQPVDVPTGIVPLVNALLHQIDIGDFVDSNGHSAKMLKPVHDLMRLLSDAPALPVFPVDEEVQEDYSTYPGSTMYDSPIAKVELPVVTWIPVDRLPEKCAIYRVLVTLGNGNKCVSLGYWDGEGWQRVHEAGEYQDHEPYFDDYDMKVTDWKPLPDESAAIAAQPDYRKTTNINQIGEGS